MKEGWNIRNLLRIVKVCIVRVRFMLEIGFQSSMLYLLKTAECSWDFYFFEAFRCDGLKDMYITWNFLCTNRNIKISLSVCDS